MNQDMRSLLRDYETTPVEINEITYPAPQSAGHSLLVIPSENLLEMMEETAEEEDSFDATVQKNIAESAQLTLADGLRRSIAWLLEYNELPAEYQPLEKLSTDQLYAAYRLLQESEEPLDMLDEEMVATEHHLPVPDANWAEYRQEDGAFWLKLPQGREYEAPIIIPMGGYNECPMPEIQATVFRAWQQQYDALPIAVSESTWILRTGRRPETDADALILARQHLLFCPYVLESFDTLGEYASYLKQQDIWYFWWD
ncbi:DUF4253 domain-containing protein [Paenibacillus hunanensis]|uniref:DUF4253 domain-containing protein n=1 Tax=Paenibacillus hunanensis TaxID=539262 RepID=UPI002A6B660F|nr:DUF4253 domain-containing protein [Paenibacillus hunanensis]WPP40782.1 DUF4253 domain-containing protein [Paenibacillus hunanensis]